MDQGLRMFGFQGLRAHPSIAQFVQLVCNERQYSFPVDLGCVAAIPISVAELFELVVQVFQSVFAFW